MRCRSNPDCIKGINRWVPGKPRGVRIRSRRMEYQFGDTSSIPNMAGWRFRAGQALQSSAGCEACSKRRDSLSAAAMARSSTASGKATSVAGP